MDNELRIVARKEDWEGKIGLLICDMEGNKKTGVVRPSDIAVTKTDDVVPVEPSLHISLQSAQILMDELWNCGIKPAKYDGNKGQLKAVEYHLEDMRKIAFGELKKR